MILYEIKATYDRQTGEDAPRNVKETYLFEGINCADVETRLTEMLAPYVSGDFEVQNCHKVQYGDIIDNETAEYFYKVRVEFITVSDSGKESRKKANLLVRANSLMEALKVADAQNGLGDMEIISLAKSPIVKFQRAIQDVRKEN